MPLNRESGVCVDSWVEMTANVPMRYEINDLDERATLYFGQQENYVLTLGRDNLEQVVALAGRAIAALDTARESHTRA
jgi:hypothetical protein